MAPWKEWVFVGVPPTTLAAVVAELFRETTYATTPIRLYALLVKVLERGTFCREIAFWRKATDFYEERDETDEARERAGLTQKNEIL
jgi:hypothetical protein